MAREQGNNGLYACPCCGYAILEKHDSYEICQMCFWEDDGQDDPDADENRGGPNYVSLKEARKNFLTLGSAEKKDLSYVRKPEAGDEDLRRYTICENKVCSVKNT
jgi:hypothetical protein